MTVARLIVDPPQPGEWNMAVDEALLHSAGAGLTTLRFYEWSAATLSLGYFQAYGGRELHAASRDLSCVRRSSGGGAILHDHELTYSFAAPVIGRGRLGFDSVYAAFHESLVGVLAEWGLHAHLCGPDAKEHADNPPFLCFQRRARGDVLLGPSKVCGSAQRRLRGALLQHGSVILKSSSWAPEILGIEQLSGRSLASAELANAWGSAIASRIGTHWQRGELTPQEGRLAEEFRSGRFASHDWLRRR